MQKRVRCRFAWQMQTGRHLTIHSDIKQPSKASCREYGLAVFTRRDHGRLDAEVA
jgi:hypothetical protein